MTAAASKYSGAMPFILKAFGKSSGHNKATTLNSQAAAVPRPIRLNMLSCQVLNDAHARSKNGQPAQSTTGVLSAPCAQLNASRPSQRLSLIHISEPTRQA